MEIAYFLRQLGFEPALNEKISGHETDILLREQELVVEVTHLRLPEKIESASIRVKPKSRAQDVPKGVDATHLMERHMVRYFEERKFRIYIQLLFVFVQIVWEAVTI